MFLEITETMPNLVDLFPTNRNVALGPMYRFLVGASAAVLFAIQPLAQGIQNQARRETAGLVVSLLFLAAIVEYSTLAVGRKFAADPPLSNPGPPRESIAWIASGLLCLNIFSNKLSAYLPLPHRGPPTLPLAILIAFWLAVLRFSRRFGRSRRTAFVALGGLILGTRVLVLGASPFDRLNGDMLANIDRGLGALFQGRFPYAIFPLPMPYLPATLLAYAPAKLLGIDLRFANLGLDVATVALAIFATSKSPRRSRLWALPIWMLHPFWSYYGVNTHFSPSLFATTLFGCAILSGGARSQAFSLGFAVAANQMSGALGPIVFAHWARRFGFRRAFGWSLVAFGTFFAIVAPFLFWNPRQFLFVAFFLPRTLPPEIMAGRLSLFPFFSRIVPQASLVLTALSIAGAFCLAWRSKTAEGVVAATAIGLCAALLAQPTSFTHYYLPVLVLAALSRPKDRRLPTEKDSRLASAIRHEADGSRPNQNRSRFPGRLLPKSAARSKTNADRPLKGAGSLEFPPRPASHAQSPPNGLS